MPSLPNLAWMIVGITITALAMLAWRRRSGATPATSRRPRSEPVPATATALVPPVPAAEAHALALSLAQELANIVSGVEARAHHLIEAAPTRALLPAAAEALLAAVQRLRTLHTKLLAFGQGRLTATGSTDVDAIVHSLVRELAEMQFGIELRWELPPQLPRLAVHHDIARDTMLFLCAAMLRAERGATHLSVAAEVCFANDAPRVQIELALEWVAEAASTSELLSDPGFTLDLEAANNLAVDHGGDVTVFHLPGRSVRAVVRWPVAVEDVRSTCDGDAVLPAFDDAAALAVVPDADVALAAPTHGYGGTILLETDPAIRAVLANELKATGRAVFACADVAAACSMLEATPDRFELLVVDHPRRLEANDCLAQTIRSLTPGLKIFVLGQGTTPALTSWPQLHFLPKPFGLHELRRALASVLAAG